ncbi:sugar phosphate isomerase/epimerase family protein [Streptomyces reniochalinae]|uniref:Sugar phosphate isomerase/epimerase n=1 Tax=Streptomyces reniochalinae TaxID=2250578 RepID=A0A367E912_9ACTN|nr:sugar phosphate isomerase/epimerase family protein [Streptomyces reniochalinae]RCG14546.1 sugar phosphate isomerase/epimerase [Streptomyces reniochalinae]
MRLAFSTLGVPGAPLDDVLRAATRSGFHGVELRAHPEEPVHPGLDHRERAQVAERFADAGVELLCVAGYPKMAARGDDAPVLAEVSALLQLAHDLGAPYARVFPGGDTDPGEADVIAVRRLTHAAGIAEELGVRVLLETHDSHRTGADAARVLDAVDRPGVGALWDVLHTWRGGEEPQRSCELLAPHLGYVQVKDVPSRQDTTPLPPGEGVLPLAEVVEVVTRSADARTPAHGLGTGVEWLCWEYEKRWYPEVRELTGLLPGVRAHLMELLADAA